MCHQDSCRADEGEQVWEEATNLWVDSAQKCFQKSLPAPTSTLKKLTLEMAEDKPQVQFITRVDPDLQLGKSSIPFRREAGE